MFDDELDELREQEQTLLDELEAAEDREARQQLEAELDNVQTEIEELEEKQTSYMGAIMMEMFDEDDASDDGDWDN